MTHHNAEIWAKRHESIQMLIYVHARHVADALNSAIGPLHAAPISANAKKWERRARNSEQRVWHALCVAKDWRKA